MNKRGQIAIGVLAGIALAFSVAALIAMLSFKGNLETSSKELSELINEVEFNKQYALAETKLIASEVISSCNSCEDVDVLASLTIEKTKEKEKFFRSEKLDNPLAKLENADFTFAKIYPEKNYRLEIKNVFVKSERGYSKIRRNFDICLIFSEQGEFIRDCETQ